MYKNIKWQLAAINVILCHSYYKKLATEQNRNWYKVSQLACMARLLKYCLILARCLSQSIEPN